jgi:hypothetical protein
MPGIKNNNQKLEQNVIKCDLSKNVLTISFNQCLNHNKSMSNIQKQSKNDNFGKRLSREDNTIVTNLPYLIKSNDGKHTVINVKEASQFQLIINERKCKYPLTFYLCVKLFFMNKLFHNIKFVI